MGLLVNGEWVDQWYDTKATGGRFVRSDSAFRNHVTRDESSGFKGESGRYHLYASLACPWAHRILIMRKLKGLEADISLTIVHYLMLENGWEFKTEGLCTPDPLGHSYMYQVYQGAKPDYTGRVTVPVLWDKKTGTIVSNESSEILLMLNSEFECGNSEHDYYPEHLRGEIDEINAFVYENVNNGVYKAGFATTQEVYEEAVRSLFSALDQLEDRLGRSRYLVGNHMTVADIRLFTTLVRFDAVYVGHFKCNIRKIEDYPSLSNFLRDLYQVPGIAETVDFEDIKRHYHMSHTSINPTQVVPVGPEQDLTRPHDRARFS